MIRIPVPANASAEAMSHELRTAHMNVAFARVVLEDAVDGRAWASEVVGYGAVHVAHPYGMSLVWGSRVDAAFDEIVDWLARGRYRTRPEWLQIDPRWAHLPWRRRLRPLVDERLNFSFDRERFESARPHLGPPAGWTIVPADVSDFGRQGTVVPREFWRDAPQFLAHGGGWRAESDGTRGALAFGSFRFDDRLEIGIETAPPARGRGLGAATAARMIAGVLERGLTPVWACRAGNAPSRRLAEKLGFRPSHRFPYYRLDPPAR